MQKVKLINLKIAHFITMKSSGGCPCLIKYVARRSVNDPFMGIIRLRKVPLVLQIYSLG